jgi:hypothetical protein
MFGIASDVKVEKEELVTKELANHLPHVPHHFNILVSTTPNHAVHADTAHKDQDTLSDQTDLVVIESERPVTASQDSMRTSGIASDVLTEKEDQPIKDNANQSVTVTLQDNILVSGTPNHAVPVDTVQTNQDGLLEPIEPVVTDLSNHATAFQDLTKTSGTVLDVQEDKEDLLINKNVTHLLHVTVHNNILVSTTPNHAVNADTAQVNQDGLSDKTDKVAIE